MHVNPETGWVEQYEAEIILQSRLIASIPNVSFMVEEENGRFQILVLWLTFSAIKLARIESIRITLVADLVNDETFDLTSFILRSMAKQEEHSTAGHGIYCRRKENLET